MAELIVAFDVASAREALELADRMPALRWAKLGPVLFAREGPEVVREFQGRGVNVFLDLKWHDIPSTVAGAVRAARELGVALATVHCLGGRAMLEQAVSASGELPLVGVTVLTSHGVVELEETLGRGIPDLGVEAERLARIAVASGLRGVVASGAEVPLLRARLGPNPWLVVPGIRMPGEPTHDQRRTITPSEAVGRGATHLVVGRPITAASDPGQAFARIAAAM